MKEQKKTSKINPVLQFVSTHPWLNNWFPVVFLCGFIFYLSSQPYLPQPSIQIPFFDKFEHIVMYGILGFFCRRAFHQSKNPLLNRFPGVVAILFCILYGISDEYHQSFVPPREVSMYDVMADGIGGILGQWIYSLDYIQRFINRFYGKN